MRRSFFDLPLRFQIMIPFSLLIILLTAAVVGFGLPLTKRASSENVDLKLDSSRSVFLSLLDGEMGELKRTAALAAEAPELRQAIAVRDRERVAAVLEGARAGPLDALQASGPDGVSLGAAGGHTPLRPNTIVSLAQPEVGIVPSTAGKMLVVVQAIGPPGDPAGFVAAGQLMGRLLPALKPSGGAEVAVYQDGSLVGSTFDSSHGEALELSAFPPEISPGGGPLKKGFVLEGHGYAAVYDLLSAGNGGAFAVFVPRSQVWPGEELLGALLAGTVGIALILLVLGFAIAAAIARRMERVVEAIERIGGGDFQQRVRLDSGDEVGRLAQVVDRMAARLQEAEAGKAEFLGMASHELKTPLALIDNAAEVLLDEAGAQNGGGSRRELLEIIAGNVERLKRRVGDLLDLARLEAGHLTLHCRPLDLVPLLTEAAEGIRPMLAPRGQTVSLDVPPSLPRVEADPDRVQQVLLNLLSNAARHTTPDTQITLRARLNGRGVTIEVEDNGPGLPGEKLERLLDAKRRAFSGEGGLGLLIAQRLVVLHSGRIWGKSEAGGGTLFAFALPLAKEER